MRRQLALLKDYSNKRMAFGHRLSDLPLHAQLIEELEQGFQRVLNLPFLPLSCLE